jgi:sugar phosphate isomerase/epimerase
MRYGVAVWNYMEPRLPLGRLIGALAEMGFGSMALQLHFLGELEAAQWRELNEALAQDHLTVTLHTNFVLFHQEHLQTVVDQLGGRLLDVTFDAAMATTSSGTFYDMATMAPVLEAVAQTAPGLRFGVEDFPFDAVALETYGEGLRPLLDVPGFGALLDVGHLNLRLRQHPYFGAGDAAQYVGNLPVPIHEVHVHDNDGARDEHRHLGQGNTDLAGAAQGLRDIGFDGICTLEVAPGMHGATPAESRPDLPNSLALWRGLMQP